ncbi:hypothetical protein C8F04DRAFT_966949, partial [Mycena alexandri]
PILALPTCKHVKAEDSRTIYEVVMEAWRSSGAAEKVGRIWSWATDGDMIRRVAGYEAFLTQKLSHTSTSRIYGTLAGMAGLHLWTGPDDVTLDFKHLFKRKFRYSFIHVPPANTITGVCTLLRSPAGIAMNNGRIINPTMLARY